MLAEILATIIVLIGLYYFDRWETKRRNRLYPPDQWSYKRTGPMGLGYWERIE